MNADQLRAYETGKTKAENDLAWRAWWIAAAVFTVIGWILRGMF